jgi:quercetin dioxygenase-like cupin family protein
MRVIRRQEAVQSEEPDRFTGRAVMERYASDVGGYVVNLVRFEAGSGTHWHSHPRGQVLFVTSGAGFVEEDGSANELREGDVVIADPGVPHRHGAASGSPMSHLSVTQEAATRLESR